jgi:hypothetical protein
MDKINGIKAGDRGDFEPGGRWDVNEPIGLKSFS